MQNSLIIHAVLALHFQIIILPLLSTYATHNVSHKREDVSFEGISTGLKRGSSLYPGSLILELIWDRAIFEPVRHHVEGIV